MNQSGEGTSIDLTQKLSDPGAALPGCSLPITIDENGDAVFAFQTHDAWTDRKLSKAEQATFVENLKDVLDGLSLLHESGISYGRISRETFCHRGEPKNLQATIHVDPQRIQTIDEVSGGHREEPFWLAERIQSAREPRPEDDWYALGVVLAGILLGPARLDSIWANQTDKSTFASALTKNLRFLSADRQLKGLTQHLLSVAGGTSVSARSALGKLDRPNFSRRWIALTAASIAGLCYVLYQDFQSQKELAAAKQTIADNQTIISEQETGLTQRDDRLRELKSELRRSRSSSSSVSAPAIPIVSPNAGQSLWDQRIADDNIATTIRRANQFLSTADDSPDRDAIEDWAQELVDLNNQHPHLSDWYRDDQTLRELILLAINRPWQADFAGIGRQSRALQAALKTWQQWAKSKQSFDDLTLLHQRMSSGGQRDALGRWLNEMQTLSSLDFQVVDAKTSQEYTTDHRVTIRCGNETVSEKWAWKTKGSSKNPLSLQLDSYKPGQPIQIILGQDGYLYDSNVIDHTLSGPLVPWQLSSTLTIRNSDTGYELRLRTSRRVGPPRLSSVPRRANLNAAQSKSETENTVDNRPEYDPLKKLVP